MFEFDYPTVGATSVGEYWSAVYNYFASSPLSEVLDFSSSSSTFSATFKSDTPFYYCCGTDKTGFSMAIDESGSSLTLTARKIGSSYSAAVYSFSTGVTSEGVPEYHVPIKIFKSENTILMFYGGVEKTCPFMAFDDGGRGLCLYHCDYYNVFAEAANATSGTVTVLKQKNYNKLWSGSSMDYYLKPMVCGSAVFNGLLCLDGGNNSSNISGEFTFNGSKYYGMAGYGSDINWVVKL